MIRQYCHAYINGAGEIQYCYELDKPLPERDLIAARNTATGEPVALTRRAFALELPAGVRRRRAAELRALLEPAAGPVGLSWRPEAPAELRGLALRPATPRGESR